MIRAESVTELCGKIGDGEVNEAAYRGGWKPA
jgi:hypothetical protein